MIVCSSVRVCIARQTSSCLRRAVLGYFLSLIARGLCRARSKLMRRFRLIRVVRAGRAGTLRSSAHGCNKLTGAARSLRNARSSIQPVADVAGSAAVGVVRGAVDARVAGSVCAGALLQGALAVRRRCFGDGLVLRARALGRRRATATAVVFKRVGN